VSTNAKTAAIHNQATFESIKLEQGQVSHLFLDDSKSLNPSSLANRVRMMESFGKVLTIKQEHQEKLIKDMEAQV
jgi:hypothetical protein